MKIVLIGYGNVGWHLSRFLKPVCEELMVVTSKPNDKDDFFFSDTIPENADFYIITRQEKFVSDTSKKIKTNNGIVVHTSGTLPAEVLNKHRHYGVLYPFQTFRKGRPLSVPFINFAIEANDQFTINQLTNLCDSIHQNYYLVTQNQRIALNVTGVLSSNFPNFLYVISYDILEKYNLHYEILKPLIKETIERLDYFHPADVQTGPAIRNDSEIIAKHLELLKKDLPIGADIYEVISKAIIKYYLNEKL